MNRFNITEVRAILIFLALNFVTLGIVLAVINYNFQASTEQRNELVDLTKTIHNHEAANVKATQELVDRTLQGVIKIIQNQKNDSKVVTDLLLTNQEVIRNNTGTNLNQTFANRATIVHEAQEIDRLLALLENRTK